MGKNYRIEVDGKRYVVVGDALKKTIDATIEFMNLCNDFSDIQPTDKKLNKRHLYKVSSYTPEMGWFREYTGYSKDEALSEYRRCRRIYDRVDIVRGNKKIGIKELVDAI